MKKTKGTIPKRIIQIFLVKITIITLLIKKRDVDALSSLFNGSLKYK